MVNLPLGSLLSGLPLLQGYKNLLPRLFLFLLDRNLQWFLIITQQNPQFAQRSFK